MAFLLTLTTAGLDALVDAQNGATDPIEIAEVAFSADAVTPAPTLTGLPSEIKRIASVSGTVTSETVIHMTAQDASSDAYDLRTFALFLADGTMFAVYSQAAPIVSKAAELQLQLAFDVAFGDSIAGDITFGDATFLFPAATETVKGVAEIATQAEVDAGTDDERIVTPAKLAAVVAAIVGGFTSATETVEGVIELATQTEVDAGTDDTRAVTALKLATRLAPVIQSVLDEETARIAADDALQTAIDDEGTARINGDAALEDDIADLAARTITGAGLASGGGSLAANRVIEVLAASAAEIITGTATNRAITPAGLGPISKSLGVNGYCTVPTADPANTLLIQWGRFTAIANGLSSAFFPIAFTQAFSVITDGTSDTGTGAEDNGPAIRVNTITATGFQVFSASSTADAMTFIAIGRIDLS